MAERIEFTPWVPWTERSQLTGARNQGIYLLAHFSDGAPAGPALPLDSHIIYIGEAHGQTLIDRWRNFHRAANNGNGNHSGGRSYYENYGPIRKDLYVSCFLPPQMASVQLRTYFICFVEAKLVWEFAKAHPIGQLLNR
jgi:hypothetical protein